MGLIHDVGCISDSKDAHVQDWIADLSLKCVMSWYSQIALFVKRTLKVICILSKVANCVKSRFFL